MNKYEIRQHGNKVIVVNPMQIYPPVIVAEFLLEEDDKGIPTVHMTINPGCHVGQLLIDGKHYRPEAMPTSK